MGIEISDNQLDKALRDFGPEIPALTDEELGRAYDQLVAEGASPPGTRDEFVARHSRSEGADSAEPVEVPEELRLDTIEKARWLADAARDSTY